MNNCFWNLFISILPDKQHFDLSPDWKILALDFQSFTTDAIINRILRALGFYIFAIIYLEIGSLCFIDVTFLELITKPAIIENLDQVVRNSKKEVVKKKNKYIAKNKKQLAKLCAFVGFFLSFNSESSSLLLLCFVLAPIFVIISALVPISVPTLMPALISTLVSCFESFAALLFYCITLMVAKITIHLLR